MNSHYASGGDRVLARVAIATMQGRNYGNRFQNYAMQEAIKGMGLRVETLRRFSFKGHSIDNKIRYIRSILGRIKHRNDRAGLFRQFDNRYISFSNCVVTTEYVTGDLPRRFDKFVMGSDQIWNPHFSFNSEQDYLPFIPKEQKIAYAASFGVSSIEANREQTAALLNDIPHIAMREDAGASIVKDLTGRVVPVVLDPTMLLDASDWERIENRPSIAGIERPFCMKYVLGDDVHSAQIDQLCSKLGLAVVDLKDESLPIGPSEFVWLIHHAGLVCTDSFHASVFSALFHRAFVIYERQGRDADMSSRFDTLCGTFSFEHHRVNSPAFCLDACLAEDWSAFEARLDAERSRSLEYFRAALGVA